MHYSRVTVKKKIQTNADILNILSITTQDQQEQLTPNLGQKVAKVKRDCQFSSWLIELL